MADNITSVGSLLGVQSLGSMSNDSQLRALNAQLDELRAQLIQIQNSDDDEQTKTVKLTQTQQRIRELEARIARLRAQQTENTANTTATTTTERPTVQEYGKGTLVDVYAFTAESADDTDESA